MRLTSRNLNLGLFVLFIILLGALGFRVFDRYNILHTSGQLIIKTADKQTMISISQDNREAKFIGNGSAKLLLAPGVYHIGVSLDGLNNIKDVVVKKGDRQTVQLSVQRPPVVRSADDIKFLGLASLESAGLNNSQIINLKQAFFEFNKDAKTVDISTDTITRGPYNPDSASAQLSFTFVVYIDSRKLNAKITYIDLDHYKLVLTDPATN